MNRLSDAIGCDTLMTARCLGPDRAGIKLETGATGGFHTNEPNTVDIVFGLDTHLGHSKFCDPPWLSAEAVAAYYDRDHVFYGEFVYNNAHACLSQLIVAHSAESWTNDCDLFNDAWHGAVYHHQQQQASPPTMIHV
jgi:hypothetical protein